MCAVRIYLKKVAHADMSLSVAAPLEFYLAKDAPLDFNFEFCAFKIDLKKVAHSPTPETEDAEGEGMTPGGSQQSI